MSDDDEPQLTPANENPWYWLATIYGEHSEIEPLHDYRSLATKNRMAWNRWMAKALSLEQREKLIAKGFNASELAPFTDEEQAAFLKNFLARAGRKNVEPPDPTVSVYFSSIRFDNNVYLSGFLFPHHADFSGAKFVNDAFFNGVTFLHYANFNRTKFSGCAYFKHAAFSGFSSFHEAVFSGETDFRNARFTSQTDFLEVRFTGDANFGDAIFCFHTQFENATFLAGVDFNNATFSSATYFDKATFSSWVKFNGAEFKFHTSFANAKFKTNVPDFRDGKLREATEWHGAEWPPPPKNKIDAQSQVYTYERLKAEMERLKKHEDEQFFFAKELRARRALEKRGSLRWLFNHAYEISSSYGQSVGIPVYWLFILFLLGAAVFAVAPVHKDAPLAIDLAAGLSATNLFSLLPYKPDKEITDHLSTLAKVIGNIQSVFGLVLLFLLGLALRNRFRMR